MRIFWSRCYRGGGCKTYLRKTLAADELAAHLTFGAATEQSELCLHAEETNLPRTQINMQQKLRH